MIAFVLGAVFMASAISAGQYVEGLTVSTTYVIRYEHGVYTITVLRIGSRYLHGRDRIIASGRPDNQGYIRTRVFVPCPPAVARILMPFVQ